LCEKMPEPTHAHPNSPNPIRTHPNLIRTHLNNLLLVLLLLLLLLFVLLFFFFFVLLLLFTTASRYGDRHPFGTRAPSTMLSTCVAAWNWPSWVGTIPASLLLIVLYVAKRDWSPTIAFYIGRASEIESKRQPNKAQRSPTVSFFIGRASQIGSPTKPNNHIFQLQGS